MPAAGLLPDGRACISDDGLSRYPFALRLWLRVQALASPLLVSGIAAQGLGRGKALNSLTGSGRTGLEAC